MNGMLSVESFGGTDPKEYSLDGENWQSSSAFDGLGPGTYTAMVRDANGFIFMVEPVDILEPEALELSLMLTANEITAVASGGTGMLEYSIDGMNFQAENVFTDLINGEYTLTARDGNGCTVTAMINIMVNNLLAQASISEEILCFGETTSILVEASGGIMPYQYSLDGENYQEGNVFQGIGAGTYVVFVRDDSGQVFELNDFVITEPAVLELAVMTGDFTITTEASGGTGILLYSLDGENFSEESTFTDLVDGMYTVYVRDENGCVVSESVVLMSTTMISINVLEANSILCNGDANGLIHVEAEGGLAPYQYSLDGENFFDIGLFENLSGGNYTVIVLDANENMSMMMITILEPNPILLAVEVVANSIEIGASGGVGLYEYTIDGGMTYQDLNIFEELENGVYTAGVRDENGCTNFIEVTVMVTSVDFVQDVWEIGVFPNPTSDWINVSWNTDEGAELEFSLFTLDGRRLQVNPVELGSSLQYDIRALPSGIYLLKISDQEESGVVRIVKQ